VAEWLALTVCLTLLCWTIRVGKRRGLDSDGNDEDTGGSSYLESASLNQKDATGAKSIENPPRFPWQGSPAGYMERDGVVRKPHSVRGRFGNRTTPSPPVPEQGGAAQSSTDASLSSLPTHADRDRQRQRTIQNFMDSMTFATGSTGSFGIAPPMRPPSCPCCR
jgi:hypothetical protein